MRIWRFFLATGAYCCLRSGRLRFCQVHDLKVEKITEDFYAIFGLGVSAAVLATDEGTCISLLNTIPILILKLLDPFRPGLTPPMALHQTQHRYAADRCETESRRDESRSGTKTSYRIQIDIDAVSTLTERGYPGWVCQIPASLRDGYRYYAS